MMYSDYFALSACAFSVVYLPFMVIAQLRFSHILQVNGYDNKKYMAWLKSGFIVYISPLIGICLILLLSEVVLFAYLYNTYLYEMEYMAGFMVVVLLLAAAVAFVFQKYVKRVKIESESVPLVCSGHFTAIYLVACVMVASVGVVVNVFTHINKLIFFVPMATPFFVPLANGLLGGRKRYLKEEKTERDEYAED